MGTVIWSLVRHQWWQFAKIINDCTTSRPAHEEIANRTYILFLQHVHEAVPDLGSADGFEDNLHGGQLLGRRLLAALGKLGRSIGHGGVDLELDQPVSWRSGACTGRFG